MQRLGEEVGKLCPASPEVKGKRKKGKTKAEEEMDLRLMLKKSWGNKVRLTNVHAHVQSCIC
eukprot:336025-Pelagomonas_calceolata.AAC.14